MSDTPDPEKLPEPANLRLLRRLVLVLMGVMIVGLVTLLGLLVIRLTTTRAPLPAEITLPNGATATAFTQGPDWYAVVTRHDSILIFDRATGALRQTLQIAPAP